MFIKAMIVGANKSHKVLTHKPQLRIAGTWLNDIGFTYGSLVIAEYEENSIVLRIREKGLTLQNSDIKALLLKPKTTLFRVTQEKYRGKPFPCLYIRGSLMESLGYIIGTVVSINVDCGCVVISKE